ncbi:MAG TPA: 2-dehydropantoate 2-reductase [Anaerolineales bacterium]|jgi:2-dehydropantoate 2-reductase|nr:2-dehydropantoate 2-reductase [Anaerolineales bacterium]
MNNILIVGTGALATLFAARLTQAGYRVTLLGTWKEGIATLRKDGARLIDTNGNEHQFEVQATDDPRDCVGAKHALVLVKAWQTERAAEQLNECMAEDGLAVTLQNGLGNYEKLTRSLSLNRVALGTSTTGATLLGPGLAKAGGEGVISIERHRALGPIEEALSAAKFNVQIVDDAQSLVWGKLVINAAINPLTALLQVTNGELLERPSAREIMGALACEVAQVAKAENVDLPFDDPIAAAEDVARKTSANRSSMLQDVIRNAPTEIDAICGAVVNAGKKHGIDTPANWACWKLIKAIS